MNTTLNAGKLIPTLVAEVVPGDSFKIGCHSLVRLQPLVSPMMSRVKVYHHYFFVPTRLLWQNWERWITGNQGDSPLPAHPFANYDAVIQTELTDQMGLPDATGWPGAVPIDVTPFAAYQLIYDNIYRDQNLIPATGGIQPQEFYLQDGDNTAEAWLYEMRRRAWKHDYFTSNLPFAQKGPAVEIPIVADFEDVSVFIDNVTGANLTNSVAPNPLQVAGVLSPDVSADTLYANTSTLDVNSTTINDLRVAYSLQEWYEKQARGGSRYDENILVFFGVKTEDFRLQRPEYITGISSDVTISEVLQTSASDDTTTPQGNMAGHGYSTTSGNYGRYYAKEHGWIIGITSILPDAMYSQGIARMWTKFDNPQQKFWPQFEHLGEQETLNQEIYAQGVPGTAFNQDQGTFGYLPRYAEYRVLNNRVAGQFKTSLAHWVWQRKFSALPALEQSFIDCTPDYDVFAVTDTEEDHFLLTVVHDLMANRPMGKYGTPTF